MSAQLKSLHCESVSDEKEDALVSIQIQLFEGTHISMVYQE